MTQTDLVMREWLLAATKTAGPYDPLTTFIGLAQDVDDNGGDTLITDVSPATGAAALRVAVAAWSAPHRLSDGRWAVDGDLVEWSIADPTEEQTVQFFFYATAITAGVLKAFQAIEPAFYFPDQYRTLGLVPRLAIDASGEFDATVVING